MSHIAARRRHRIAVAARTAGTAQRDAEADPGTDTAAAVTAATAHALGEDAQGISARCS